MFQSRCQLYDQIVNCNHKLIAVEKLALNRFHLKVDDKFEILILLWINWLLVDLTEATNVHQYYNALITFDKAFRTVVKAHILG